MGFRSTFLRAACVALIGLIGTHAQAAVVTGNLTADNQFQVYISTNDSVLGTLITSGNDWRTTYSFTSPSLTASTYYLHIVGYNDGGPGNMAGGNPDAFIGQFALTGDYRFANGSTTLLTNTTDWRASDAPYSGLPPAGWVAPTGTPIDFGSNAGPNIWSNNSGQRPGIASNALWIWSSPDATGETYISTTITAVPEASTWAMMILGFLAVGFMAYRRTSTARSGLSADRAVSTFPSSRQDRQV